MKKMMSMILCCMVLLFFTTNAHASVNAGGIDPVFSQHDSEYAGEISPRFEVLSRTYEDIWVENGQIYFWAYAIPWETTEITIKMKVEETVDGKYKTIINTSKTKKDNELELLRSIPYGEKRYFRVTINYIVGPDTPTVTKYFYT